MAKDLGKVSMAYKGAYASTKTYEVLDVVTYDGSTYCAVKSTNKVPTTTTDWFKVADRGQQGIQGIQGIQGLQGNSGVESGDAVQNWNDLSSPASIPEDTSSQVNTAGAKATASALQTIGTKVDSIEVKLGKMPVDTTYPADKTSGKRNVSSTTGEFVETTSVGHYANEIALDGTETKITVSKVSNFSSNYGYAFLKADNTFVSGAKEHGESPLTIDPTSAIASGATKIRISTPANPIVVTRTTTTNVIETLQTEVLAASADVATIKGDVNGGNTDLTTLFVWTTGKALSTANDTFYSSSVFKASDYVDISAHKGKVLKIKFCNYTASSGKSVSYGYVIYNSDKVSIAYKAYPKGESAVYDLEITLPEDACYIRTTYFSDSTLETLGLSEFSASVTTEGLAKRVTKLEGVTNPKNMFMVGSPSLYVSAPTVVDNVKGKTITELYAEYDQMVSAYPNMMQRCADLGNDASGNYTLRHYRIEMKNPLVSPNRPTTDENLWDESTMSKRRIFVNCGVHGNEKMSTWGAMLAFKELLGSNEGWANYIKANLTIDICPCANPWGYDATKPDVDGNTSSSTTKANYNYNYNKVNLNRDYNSGEPQAETQHIIDLITELQPFHLHAILDVHNGSSDKKGYLVARGDYKYFNLYCTVAQQIATALLSENEKLYNNTSFYPYFFMFKASEAGQLHWYTNKLGLIGNTFEAPLNLSGSCKMTKEVLLNLIQIYGNFEY